MRTDIQILCVTFSNFFLLFCTLVKQKWLFACQSQVMCSAVNTQAWNDTISFLLKTKAQGSTVTGSKMLEKKMHHNYGTFLQQTQYKIWVFWDSYIKINPTFLAIQSSIAFLSQMAMRYRTFRTLCHILRYLDHISVIKCNYHVITPCLSILKV